MAHGDEEPEGAVFESAFDLVGGPVSTRVVEAVATFHEVDPTALAPLYSIVDPDALDALFAPSPAGRSLERTVAFQYEDARVSVTGDGTIRLGDRE